MQYSRDQFLRAMQLVIDDSLTPVERLFRERSKLEGYEMEAFHAVQANISSFKKVLSVEGPNGVGGFHVSQMFSA